MVDQDPDDYVPPTPSDRVYRARVEFMKVWIEEVQKMPAEEVADLVAQTGEVMTLIAAVFHE